MRVVDLCTGAGYMSYGFQQAGYELHEGVDIWETALRTYEKYLPGTPIHADLADYYPGRKDFDVVVIGGTPCDYFSLANKKRDIYHKKSQLVLDFCRIVNTIKPEMFVFENVIHLSKWAEEALKEIPGYKVTRNLPNSADYGVPQNRRRKIFIGSQTRHISLKAPMVAKTTVRDAFNVITDNQGLSTHRPETVEKFKLVTSDKWVNKNGNNYQGTVRLMWDSQAPAVTNYKKAQMLHPELDRVISRSEAMALQGIPQWYIPVGSESDKAKQVASAVPPLMSYGIAKQLTELSQSTLM